MSPAWAQALFPNPDDRFFELAGAVAATMWIAAAITLQNTRAATLGITLPEDPKGEFEIKFAMWFWAATIASFVAELFATAVFWSLLWLLPTPYAWLIRVVAVVLLIRLARRPAIRTDSWRDLIQMMPRASEMKEVVDQIIPDRELLIYSYILGAGYVVTAAWPNPFIMAVFVFACIAMGINVVFIALSFTSSVGSIQKQLVDHFISRQGSDTADQPGRDAVIWPRLGRTSGRAVSNVAVMREREQRERR
jgi:hypothetical protein